MADVTGIIVNSGRRISATECGSDLDLSPNMGYPLQNVLFATPWSISGILSIGVID